MHVDLVGWTDSDGAKDRIRARVHERDERVHDSIEEVERIGAPKRERERALDRQVLRRELAHDDVHVRDRREGDRERHNVQVRLGQPCEHRRDERRHRGLADPADREGREGHAQL